MPEPFQKGNSKEYVKEWERIFRGEGEPATCKKCGTVPKAPFGCKPFVYCLRCGEKLEVRDED